MQTLKQTHLLNSVYLILTAELPPAPGFKLAGFYFKVQIRWMLHWLKAAEEDDDWLLLLLWLLLMMLLLYRLLLQKWESS